ncbi:putative CRISPR locus-related DNA-binding protein Csa3 [Methanocaldococcus lauensis]|nr:putative CRISPR locus-related DNA-binding protein Csa3 [Methanocaldococcus lauensis]
MRYITTFGYHPNHIFDEEGKIIGINNEKISNMILIYSLDVDADEKSMNSIEKTKKYIESKLKEHNIPYLFVEVSPYEFNVNVKKFRKYIVPKTVINLTGGKRIVGYALFYAAILEKENVEKVFYVSKSGKIIEFPLISTDIKLTELEKEILNLLDKNGEMFVSDIAHKLKKSLSTISEYVSQLEEKGLVEKLSKGRRKIVRKVI